MPSPHCRSIPLCSTARRLFCGSDNTSDFEGLRSRQGQAEAILVAYDVMEVDGHDVQPEVLEERRKRPGAAVVPPPIYSSISFVARANMIGGI